MTASPPALTRIVATLGPAADDPEVLRRMIEAGASVCRLNFSHGVAEEHAQRVEMVRAIGRELGVPIAILGDLPGPKIRIARVEAPTGIELVAGSEIVIRGEDVDAGVRDGIVELGCSYPRIVQDVEPGHRVLIDDGNVRALVIARETDRLRCTVIAGGIVSSHKGINLPDSTLTVQAITERDRGFVEWAVAHDIDYLALSFVSQAADVRDLRRLVATAAESAGRAQLRLPVVAKIERPQAIDRMDEIIEEADAIMVARGDLGVEMDLARVPVMQRRLIDAARAWGKPVIVATQMLQSMIDAPVPTRAEASDVATAIFDGTDAVMLSGETAVGRFPVVTIETMRRIAVETEAFIATQPERDLAPAKLVETGYRTAALAHGVSVVARDWRARFLVVWSQAGGGARYLSQNELRIPIVAVSSNERALRQMQFLRGVTPIRMALPESLAAFTSAVDEALLRLDWARTGDHCILVAGTPLGLSGNTNSLALHELGNPETGFR